VELIVLDENEAESAAFSTHYIHYILSLLTLFGPLNGHIYENNK